MVALLILLVFVATFLLAAIAVVVASFFQSRAQASAGVANPAVELSGGGELPMLLRAEQSLSSIGLWDRLLQDLDLSRHISRRLRQAGLRWSIGRVTLAMLLCGSVLSACCIDNSWVPPGSAPVAFVIGAYFPYWLILQLRMRRLKKLEQQFPDALEGLARIMRAGHPLSSAFELLAAEIPAPLGTEFRQVADERRLGRSWEEAFDSLIERVPFHEVRLFVAAAQMQAKAGGRLTEVLERLADSVRETIALRGEIRAVSAQGRMTGKVLTALPLGIATIMYFTSPDYIGVLLHHPTGKTLIWIAAGCTVAGHLVISRLVRIRA